jgi:hypothetical protein
MIQNEYQFEHIQYSTDELEYRSMIIDKANRTRIIRDKTHTEFDGMTYREWWEANYKTRNGYIEPKKNESDITATTGAVREKANTILAALLNLNLEPNINPYDKSGRIQEELGQVMEDLERKSRELEVPDYDFKRALIYDEYVSQGTVFTEEIYNEFSIPDNVVENLDMTKEEAFTIKESACRTCR